MKGESPVQVDFFPCELQTKGARLVYAVYSLSVYCMCKTDQMKHLLTAIACFFALSMSAQESLPWNPNANNDNIIGTVDLLAMLNVYGEEYSVETCFRGEVYLADQAQYETMYYYLPNDCGLVHTRRYGSWGPRVLRFPSDVVDGTVIRVRTLNQQWDIGLLIFQQLNEGGQWTPFAQFGSGTYGPNGFTYHDVTKTESGWVVAPTTLTLLDYSN